MKYFTETKTDTVNFIEFLANTTFVLGAEPDLVRHWMETAKDVYDDVYGSPERGYCGAYVRS